MHICNNKRKQYNTKYKILKTEETNSYSAITYLFKPEPINFKFMQMKHGGESVPK